MATVMPPFLFTAIPDPAFVGPNIFSRFWFASPPLDKAMMDGLKANEWYAINKIRKDQTKSHFMG
jgi:hypothetical protein